MQRIYFIIIKYGFWIQITLDSCQSYFFAIRVTMLKRFNLAGLPYLIWLLLKLK